MPVAESAPVATVRLAHCAEHLAILNKSPSLDPIYVAPVANGCFPIHASDFWRRFLR